MDLSGLSVASEGAGWIDPAEQIPATLKSILREVGRFYVPFMLANNAAVRRKEKEVQCALDGGAVQWVQPAFKYQSKCLVWLRERFAALSAEDERWVRVALRGTGCEVLFGETTSRL